ncbi:putative protein OS=Streptomyces fumanus OX=67302 GN=GCM10018772_62450 PE=4 SV=1 [Streptomyces fumanus]
MPHMTGQLPVQLRDHRVERLREHRERGIQLTPHPHPLTPLPTEQQGEVSGPEGRPSYDARAGFARGECVEPRQQGFARGTHHDGTLVESGA